LYLSRCKFEFSNDPKQFYIFVNAKRKSSAFPSSLRFNSMEASTDSEIADLIALCLSFVRQPFVNRFLNFLICLFHHQFFILSGRTLFSLHFTKRVRGRMPRIKEVFLNCRQFLKLLNVLSPCHGFVKRRSTTTNLLELSYTIFVINEFKNKLQTDVIYMWDMDTLTDLQQPI